MVLKVWLEVTKFNVVATFDIRENYLYIRGGGIREFYCPIPVSGESAPMAERSEA